MHFQSLKKKKKRKLLLPLQNFSAVGISVEIFGGFDTGVQTSDHLLPHAVTKGSRQ